MIDSRVTFALGTVFKANGGERVGIRVDGGVAPEYHTGSREPQHPHFLPGCHTQFFSWCSRDHNTVANTEVVVEVPYYDAMKQHPTGTLRFIMATNTRGET